MVMVESYSQDAQADEEQRSCRMIQEDREARQVAAAAVAAAATALDDALQNQNCKIAWALRISHLYSTHLVYGVDRHYIEIVDCEGSTHKIEATQV